MTGVKGKSGARSHLEKWQWAEAEADHRAGVGNRELAERYGVSLACMRKHMTLRHIVPWHMEAGRRGGKGGEAGAGL